MSPQQYTVWNKQSKTKTKRPLPTLPYLPPSVRRIKSNTAALGIEKGKKALQEKSEQILLTHKSIPAHNYCVQSVRLVLNIVKNKKKTSRTVVYTSLIRQSLGRHTKMEEHINIQALSKTPINTLQSTYIFGRASSLKPLKIPGSQRNACIVCSLVRSEKDRNLEMQAIKLQKPAKYLENVTDPPPTKPS